MARFSFAALRRRLPRLRRRPPFALVLVGITAAIAGAFLIAGGGAGGNAPAKKGSAPTFVGSGPSRVCATARAQAVASRRTTLHISVQATVPVSASARATVDHVTVTETLSRRVVDSATVARALFVRRTATASRRACAHADTAQAAHTAALNQAYRAALPAARARSKAQSASSLAALIARVRPATHASAQQMVTARARRDAAATQRALARQAYAQARARARADAKGSRKR